MKTANILLVLIISAILVSCAVIFDPNLEDEIVTLRAPADCTITTIQTQTFWWDPVADAEKYNLQIVSPDFEFVVRLAVDTNLTGNSFTWTLQPGIYRWGVSAFNYSSATDYSKFYLKIDTALGVTGQVVTLLQPGNNTFTNKQKITFEWSALSGATSYLLQVKDSNESVIINTDFLAVTSYSDSLSDEGSYSWNVRAYDESSNTFSDPAARIFGIDRTRPGKPAIITPTLGDTLDTQPYTIEWTHPLASLAPISDSIMISSDSLFNAGSDIEIDVVTQNEYSVSSLEDGKYYVKVKSFDAAGNQGEYSNVIRFFLFKSK